VASKLTIFFGAMSFMKTDSFSADHLINYAFMKSHISLTYLQKFANKSNKCASEPSLSSPHCIALRSTIIVSLLSLEVSWLGDRPISYKEIACISNFPMSLMLPFQNV
jgi:hypothetical protein